MARMTKKDREEQARAVEHLRAVLPPGSRVYTTITHVARSGMSRRVRVFAVVNGRIASLAGYVATACGMRRHDGAWWDIVVGGCGFDAGFSVVSDLARTLYPGGFGCVGEGCPSNDHANGDWDYTPHGGIRACAKGTVCFCHDPTAKPADCAACGCTVAQHWHASGSYALRHETL